MPEAEAVSLKDFPEPVVVVEWEDGYQFEVLKVGVGNVEEGSMMQPSGTLLTPVKTSSRTFIDGKMTSVKVKYFHVDGVPTGLRCEVEDTPGLLLLCRYMNGSGRALETDAVLSQGVVRDDAIEAMGGYALDPLRFRGSRAMKEPDSKGSSGIPDLLIQVRDPEFGWISGEGFLTLDDEGANRLLALFSAWPRKALQDSGRLEFRVIRAGVEDVAEFQVPGGSVTDATSSVPKMLAEIVEFPSVIEGEEYTIELKEWAFEARKESYPFVGVDSEFISKMPGDLGQLEAEGLGSFSQSDFYWQFAESDDGNRVTARHHRFEKLGSNPGFSLPVNFGDHVTVEGDLLRRVGYPRKRDECVFLGSGEVANDGRTIKLIMDGEAKKIGLKRFEVVFDATVECVWPYHVKAKKIGYLGYRVEFELELDKASAAAYAARLGEFLQWEPVVFFDDDEFSAGVIQSNGSGTSESITGTREVTGNYEWGVRVKAGQKVRVGLAKPKENETIRIRFPVSKSGE